jgi:WhiB family redox-sensing transcriptional regulator
MRKTMDEGTLQFLFALAGPVLDGPDRGEWTKRARCTETDPEVFFPVKGESAQPAKAICARCEVRAHCLAHAIRADEEHGVWGGLSRAERVQLRGALNARETAKAEAPDKGAA